ncbi:peroxisomal membrane protein PEX16-like [Montipora capricornis]|uniref:peroxisomal membrane protein PEX16-like n=1 Tax=Montipora capricornis TaxID=246305 RepID=UPI0035F131B6
MSGGHFIANFLQTSQQLVALGSSHTGILWKKYREFVLHNPETVTKIESILRALSYILPGRFGASEALAELVFSSSQILTLFNDGIFSDGKVTLDETTTQRKNPVLLWLTVLEYLEVFIELGASRIWGEAGKWIIVVVLQIAKAALRFVLLFKHSSGIQRTPLIPLLDRSKLLNGEENVGHQNLTDETGVGEEQAVSSADITNTPQSGPTWRGVRSGRLMRSLNATPNDPVRSWRLPKDPSKAKKALEPTNLSSQRMLAESLYISRPLLHISSMFLFGQASWRPWLISCGVDVASLALVGNPGDLNEDEKAELSRRTLLLLFYLLRSPFYDNYSKTRILVCLRFMSDTIPGVSFILNPLLDYLPTWQKIYFYNWSS